MCDPKDLDRDYSTAIALQSLYSSSLMTHTALRQGLLVEYVHSQRRCYTSASAAQTAAITIATDEMCINAKPGSVAVRLFPRAAWCAHSSTGCSIANAVTNTSAKTLRRQYHTRRKATCRQQDFTIAEMASTQSRLHLWVCCQPLARGVALL